jgi:hypothetical protein
MLCFSFNPVVQANCRARFTAADFDFVIRILTKSRRDEVSLVELLTDAHTRDSVLDHPLLVQAILSQNDHLSISPQFYFYILTRHALRKGGFDDRLLCDYVASLLDEFMRTARLGGPGAEQTAQRGVVYLSDLLLALRQASPSQAFLLRAHVGNYSLFLTGIFPENIERRSRRGAPGCSFYEEMGRASYRAVASHRVAQQWGLTDVFNGLAEQFHEVRLALNQLAECLFNLDEDSASSSGLALLK